jgi:hypothetical protein
VIEFSLGVPLDKVLTLAQVNESLHLDHGSEWRCGVIARTPDLWLVCTGMSDCRLLQHRFFLPVDELETSAEVGDVGTALHQGVGEGGLGDVS